MEEKEEEEEEGEKKKHEKEEKEVDEKNDQYKASFLDTFKIFFKSPKITLISFVNIFNWITITLTYYGLRFLIILYPIRTFL